MIGDHRLGICIYTGVMIPIDLRILQMVLAVAGRVFANFVFMYCSSSER